ncbi:MAG: sister chromatid cohesion protein PDS5 [Ruminococcus sp.]|uniref:sister chromatid cohesion protein PDS5 n=1 Tax=Ruminococcus sp. TaxID=41978 RepID=UPI0025F0BA76|nr:sister chromatid cohesion protein PDS5 [Ruminococcus sp.]MCR5600399.1 sister chromatid cohesion protein PDS5 [Ruminococcus sp.]
MNETELYKELGILTKDKERWEESIHYVASLLSHESVKIQAKALWLIGEMGLAYPQSVKADVPVIASFLDSKVSLLRERAVNALGRIGRADYHLIEQYWSSLFRFANDEDAKVRLSFIWASENIATNTPDIYESYMPVYEGLLHDTDDKVRMEAPELFRVLGKRRSKFVQPYLETLQHISESDDNRVVRIHCLGAIKAAISK